MILVTPIKFPVEWLLANPLAYSLADLTIIMILNLHSVS